MQPNPLIKQIKRIPFIFLLLILSSASFKVVSDWRSIGRTKILEVRTNHLKEKTYKRVEIGENEFVTGMEGTLYWKIKNKREALLIGMADREHFLSYYDVLYFLLLDAGLFLMVHRMNEETIFSEQLSAGFKIVVYWIMFYPFVTLIANHYSKQFIEELTNYQFTAYYESLAIGKFQIIFYLLIFMYPFIQKAIDLQKDQNLTI